MNPWILNIIHQDGFPVYSSDYRIIIKRIWIGGGEGHEYQQKGKRGPGEYQSSNINPINFQARTP